MTSPIQYSVKSIFNPASFGLDSPYEAVLAALPSELGGGVILADLVATRDLGGLGLDSCDLEAAFVDAADRMPWRRTDLGGLRIQFLAVDSRGDPVRQGTMHLPLKEAEGPRGLAETYHDWLAWRVRVGLWTESQNRKTLGPAQEQRLLRNLLAGPEHARVLRDTPPELVVAA
jgi:hypothetical protein